MPPTPKPPDTSRRNRTLVIAIAVALIVAAGLGAASYLTRDKGDNSAVTTATTGTGANEADPAVALVAGIPQKGTVLGSPTATVTMLQFEDLQCPYCKQYTETVLPAIIDEYVRPGLVKIDFRGLARLGPDSLEALRITVAAGLQDKLWEVAGLFYENQGAENSGWVTNELIDQILAKVPGLGAAQVKKDAGSETVTRQIAATNTQANDLGVQGPPWFYLKVGVGAPQPISPIRLDPASFRLAFDKALGG